MPETEQPSDLDPEQIEDEAAAAQKAATRRTIRRTKIATFSILGLCIILGIYVYLQTAPPPNGKYDAFAQCIANTSTTFYGAWWCPHCAAQKTEFGDAAKYLPYVECANTDTSEKQSCAALGVSGYPTWDFPDGTTSTGVSSLANIAKHTGCALPTST
jgi:hypothetical protein